MTVFRCRDCNKWFWKKLSPRRIAPLGHRFLYYDEHFIREYSLKPFKLKFKLWTIFRCDSKKTA